jgi:hypothetical protein
MTKNVATRMLYTCDKCVTKIELHMPYHFPDGTRFPWESKEVAHPECPLQYAKDSGYPGEHVMQWKMTKRVKEE